MDHYAIADIWRVHEELRSLKAGQLECVETLKQHAGRLAQLESRGNGDDKIRSLWDTSSPFPALTPGSAFHPTPMQNLVREPPEEFDGFEVERGNNLLSSLPLDEIDVPRRGASRANSVRFDTTLHTRWVNSQEMSMPNPLNPADYFGHRSNNASIAGGHPLTERAMSFKSDGRHSSMRSFDNTSFYDEGLTNGIYQIPARSSGSTPGHPGEPSVPSIIRCWIDNSFSPDTIIYAAVCTGSARSTIDQALIVRFGLEHQLRDRNGEKKIALSVYLPDAVTQRSAPSANGHVPRIVTEFTVIPAGKTEDRIQVFLGSDILSAQHADILFSQRQVVLFVEDGSQMFVPFVEPRNEGFYTDVCTYHRSFKTEASDKCEQPRQVKDAAVETAAEDFAHFSLGDIQRQEQETQTDPEPTSPTQSRTDESHPHSPLPTLATSQPNDQANKAGSSPTSNQALEWRAPRELRKDEEVNGIDDENRSTGSSRPDRPSVTTTFGGVVRSSNSNPRSAKETSGVWDSWRRGSISSGTNNGTRPGSKSVSSGQGTQRGMKVLRASKATPLTTKKEGEFGGNSEQTTPAPERPNSLSRATSSISIGDKGSFTTKQRSVSSMSGSTTTGHTKARSTANPIGGASAFHWMAAPQPAAKPTTST